MQAAVAGAHILQPARWQDRGDWAAEEAAEETLMGPTELLTQEAAVEEAAAILATAAPAAAAS